MTLSFRFTNTDSPLYGSWRTQDTQTGLTVTADFVSPLQDELAPIPGVGTPDIQDPATLTRLPAIPSRRVVTSLESLTLTIDGEDYSSLVTGFDVAKPMHGEVTGVIELRDGRNPYNLDPSVATAIKAGAPVDFEMRLPGQTVPLVKRGFIVEPPRFRLERFNVGSLSLRVGDIFLLKRQSETGRREPYCGNLPNTVAQAAQIFARIRELPGTFGGNAVVENINPDFVEGAPWDFLASLYEVIDFDVRTTAQGEPVAVPRATYNAQTAIELRDWQVSEASFDSPASLPFSKVPGYNNFQRSLGYRSQSQTREDFSRWNPADTQPWFQTNNTYQVIRTQLLGDTEVVVETQTWGYLPNNTLVPSDNLPPAETGPCGEFIPPPTFEPVSTRLDIIQTRRYRVYFEPHISGSYVVVGTEENVTGWNTYQDADGNTILYFGPLEGIRETFSHTPLDRPNVCAKYWDLVRTASETIQYSRVTVGENVEPEYRLTQRRQSVWTRSDETITEGQVTEWTVTENTQNYDADAGRWVGGNLPVSSATSPPTAVFINEFTVPVNLEVETEFPELEQLFGDRESKPVQFPNAYTTRDLLVATERYARETAGLAYSLHLIVDPRIPIRPGNAIRYIRPDGSQIHGLAWSVEYNATGPQTTQSVVLMRTFTEPGLAAVRANPGFVPTDGRNLEDPCF